MTHDQHRCPWANSTELMAAYHDTEWGVPVHDDRHLFEMLCLEGAQAGLSWQTILARRENYRRAFDNFAAEKIAQYTEAKRAALLQDAGIIRNRLKVNAFIENAKATLAVQQKHGSLDAYLWSFVGDRTLTDHDQAANISKQLKKDGFRFVGPTTCYAFMQAVGMMNDHAPECFRYRVTTEQIGDRQNITEDVSLSAKLATAKKQVPVGARYMHYKQRSYKVIAVALREEDTEPCVVYQAEYEDELVWIRPVANWNEDVTVDGKTVQRFTKLS
ncbi:MAG TPA: DUF1653 domain-containing protein [Candidatus Saccharimonadales bacterium]|nr:DUF1653 domain-containing protein [Candidatus Saccharimonadales bacterium]